MKLGNATSSKENIIRVSSRRDGLATGAIKKVNSSPRRDEDFRVPRIILKCLHRPRKTAVVKVRKTGTTKFAGSKRLCNFDGRWATINPPPPVSGNCSHFSTVLGPTHVSLSKNIRSRRKLRQNYIEL